jgi:hypothetical protein
MDKAPGGHHGTNSDEIRVGGLNLEGGGRDSNHSNRGSDVDIKEAIQKVMQDEQLQSQMKKLLTQ